MGVVGLTGVNRSYKCPRWVTSLQQAELWGIYLALKICVYIHRNATHGAGGGCFNIGTDSEVARWQCTKGHASSNLKVQHRILRRIFWLRSWSGCHVTIFRVPSPANPADPPSRLTSFTRKGEVKRESERRKSVWRALPHPYDHLVHLRQAHWNSY